MVIVHAVQAGTDRKPVQEIYFKDKAVVLLYHDIQPSFQQKGANEGTLTVQMFREHLQMIKNRGFRVISMDSFINFMLHGSAIPPNAIVLTFDDGYESFYTNAFPVLREFGFTASNFVIGMSSDLFNPDADPHLSWDQMRELKAVGMGIYSHTYDLHRFVPVDQTGLQKEPALTSRRFLEQKRRVESETEYRKRIASDMDFMNKRLEEELGPQPRLLAFPFGAYDQEAMEEAVRAETALFFTVEEGMNETGGRLIRRVNAGEPYMNAEALWTQMNKIMENQQK